MSAATKRTTITGTGGQKSVSGLPANTFQPAPYWYRLRLCIYTCLVPFSALATQAALTWPGVSSEWTALTTGGGSLFYGDPDDENPGSVDIEGDAIHAALFWYYQDSETPLDESDDQLLFRIRLDSEPNNPQYTWQILLDTDDDVYLDYVLEYDTSGTPDAIKLAPTGVGEATVSAVTIDTASLLWSSALVADFTRFVAADDGSNFDGNPDVFLDLGIPWSDFSTATGLTTSDSFRFGVSTSTTDQSINKDVPLGLTSTASVEDLLGDAIIVPEPGGLSLLGMAAGFTLLRRRG